MTEPENAPPQPTRRIEATHAAIAVVVAFLVGQLAGKTVSDLVASSASLRGAGHAPGQQLVPEIVVPAMIASELALLLVALAMPLLSALPVRETLGLRRASIDVLLAAAFGTVMLGPVGDVLMTALSRIAPNIGLGVVPALRDVTQKFPLALTWPAFALMPGLAEELLFRGVLQRSIAQPVVAVLVSGAAFAAFHVDPIHVIGVLPLGLFLAWVCQRAGTLVTIFAHVVNNTVALLTIKSATLDVGFGTQRELPVEWLIASLAGALLAVRIIARATKAAA